MFIDLDPASMALIPIVVGLVELLKRLGLPSNLAPLAALALGTAGALFYVAPGEPGRAILSGLIIALSAMGLYSGPKAAAQALKASKG